MRAWIDFLTDRVRRYVHRYGHRMVQASGQLDSLYVSLTEAGHLLSTAPTGLGLPPPKAPLPPPPAEGPILDFAQRLGIDGAALPVLMAAVGPQISVDLSRLYGFAWADFAVKLPSVGFLGELLSETDADLAACHAALSPGSPLLHYHLVELAESSAWGPGTPRLHRGVRVPDTVVDHLRGLRPGPPPLLRACAELDSEPLAVEGLHADPSLVEEIQRALDGVGPRLLLLGDRGAGRRSLFGGCARAAGYGLLTLDLSKTERRGEAIAIAAREAQLRRAVLLLRGDALFEDRDAWEGAAAEIGAALAGHPGAVAFTATGPVAGLHHHVPGVLDLAVRLPDAAGQRAVWQAALEPEEEALATDLARRFIVSPGVVHGAVAEARAQNALRGDEAPLDVASVARAVRKRLAPTLSQVAEPFTTSLTWEDVILPPEVQEILDEILAHARHRETVYDTWGFRRKVSYGRGLGCLFAGPPGTGKTMVAALLAKSLGRELYRVDLSRVVSKWVGETEKNLGRVFDEAEKAQVILLFDEADALFGSRTEVRGSNDRFANMEINYLLQRMESFDGMSLLTTNFEQSLDEAFKRRLKFKIDFPLPDGHDRTQLWQVMLPEQAQVAPEIDFARLGKKFKLAGGHIKNAVLRAAFYAAEAGRPIDFAMLEKAAVAESRSMGRL